MDTGQRIKEYRKLRKITQRQLAAFLGVTPSYISHIESGSRNVPVDILARIARYLNVRMSLLVNEEAPPSRFLYASRGLAEEMRPDLEMCSKLHANLWELENMVCGRPGVGSLSRLADLPTVPRKAAGEVRALLGFGAASAIGLEDLVRALALQHVTVFQLPLTSDLAGLTSRDPPPAIFLNVNLSRQRRLFVLAEQLGHLALHQYGVTLDKPQRRRVSEDEEAYEFALEFLLPAELVQRVTWILPEGMDRTSLGHAMASFLGLEPAVVFERLDELGRLPRSVLGQPRELTAQQSQVRTEFDPLIHLPERYLMLARLAFERREINAAKLAELLMVTTERALQCIEALFARG